MKLIVKTLLVIALCSNALATREYLTASQAEDEEGSESDSGSGAGDGDETSKQPDTKGSEKIINTKLKSDRHDKTYEKRSTDTSLPEIHKLWQYWHDKGFFFDLGTENLMTEATGAHQIMDSIASKLVSHASDQITNHFGDLIQNSIAEKKSNVHASGKTKKISSNTEVVPALTVTKLGGNDATNTSVMSLKTNETTRLKTENKSKSSQRDALPATSKNDKAAQGTGSEVKSIGPMEGIVITVNGSTNTINNFTQVNKEKELATPKILDFKKAEKDDSNEANKKNLIKNKKNQKAAKKNKSKKSKSKKNKKSKRNKIFPKIILYQGPISKALENILKVHGTSNFINSPMSFEEATHDIKRSRIAHPYKKMTKLHDDDYDDSDEELDDDIKDDETQKKSKVATKQPKKYVVKGYHDNGKTEKKIDTRKTSYKGEMGRKKNAVLIVAKKGRKSNRKLAEDGKNDFPLFPKVQQQTGKEVNTYKPSIVPSDDDEDVSPAQFNNFIKQMALPISTSETPTPFFAPPEFEYHVKHTKNSKQNSYSKPQLNSIIGNTPKPSGNIMEGNLAESSNKNNNKEAPDDGYEFEYPNPAGYPNNHKGDDDDDAEVVVNNGTNGTHPIYVQAPIQQHPKPANNPGTPKPVTNAPDVENVNQHNQGSTVKPKPGQQTKPQTSPLIDELNPQSESDSVENDDDKIEPPAGGFEFPGSIGIKPETSPNPNLVGDLLERVQANSHEIDSINNEVRDVESRLEEIGSTVNHIEKYMERIENKIDTTKTLDSKQVSPNIDVIKPSGSIPIELITGGKFPIRFPPRIITKFKKPRILKQFFIPLPPPNSQASQQIEQGAPIPGLPFPLNQVVSFLLRKVRKYGGGFPGAQRQQQLPIPIETEKVRPPTLLHAPMALPEISLPPREHDLDRLEMELGRVPISRMNKKPRIVLFSKSPNIIDLTETLCDEPCHNGGECIGGNVCKCPPMFTGVKCDRIIHRASTPGDIMDLFGHFPSIDDVEPRKSNTISLPLVLTEANDDDDVSHQKTMGQVDQSKLVDLLSTFTKPGYLDFKRRRSGIPHPSTAERKYVNYPRYQRFYR